MQQTNPNCPCKNLHCARHGDCETCRAHHLSDPRKIRPACERARAKKAEPLKK